MKYLINGNTTKDVYHKYFSSDEMEPNYNAEKCDCCKFIDQINICSTCFDLHPWGHWQYQKSIYELEQINKYLKRKIENLLHKIEINEKRIRNKDFRIDNHPNHISWINEQYGIKKK